LPLTNFSNILPNKLSVTRQVNTLCSQWHHNPQYLHNCSTVNKELQGINTVGSFIIIIINDIYIPLVRKSQLNCAMVPQMHWITYRYVVSKR